MALQASIQEILNDVLVNSTIGVSVVPSSQDILNAIWESSSDALKINIVGSAQFDVWEPDSGTATIKLGDNAGVEKLSITDSDDAEVASINSDGDLAISGSSSIAIDEVIQGTLLIDTDNAEALLIRKDGDADDVFTVDTINSVISIGGDLNIANKLTHDGDADTYLQFSVDQAKIIVGGATAFNYDEGALNTLAIDQEGTADISFGGGNVFFGGAGGSSDGNVGIGNSSLEAWHTDWTALQIGGNASLVAQTTQGASKALILSQNMYFDGLYKYISTDQASRYLQVNGTHIFDVITSGSVDTDTAGNLTTALTIANDANVGIGNASLEVWQSGWRALQIGGNAALFAHATPAASRHLYLTNNLYHDGSFKTISTDESNAIAMLHGTFVFKVGALASLDTTPTFTDALTIANNANIGIETENLATWTSTVSALQVGGTAGLSSETTQADGTKTWVSANAYHSSSTDTWKYISTNASDEANSIMFSDGAVRFRTAIAGVADAGISWINQLVLQNNSGSLSATFGGDIFVTKDGATLTITDTDGDDVGSGGTIFLVQNDGGTIASGSRLGILAFKASEDGASTISTGAYIASYTTELWSAGNNGAEVQFKTTPNASATPTLALTLQQDQSALFAGDIIVPQGNKIHLDSGQERISSNGSAMLFDVAGGTAFTMSVSGFQGNLTDSGSLQKETSSATNPVHSFTNNNTYGLGGLPSSNYVSMIANSGEGQRWVEDTSNITSHFPEATTPTPIADYWSVYGKADNHLYFQTGAGAEVQVALVGTDVGEMYLYEASSTVTINTTDVYHGIYGFTTGDVDNFTFDAGAQIDANIANESDATQLQIETSGVHGLTTGDVVTLSNMNNAGHNLPTVVTVLDTTNFTCDDILYVAGAGASAGIVDQPSTLTVLSGGAGKYILHFSMSGQSVGTGKTFKWEMFKGGSEINTIVAERKHGNSDIGNMGSNGFTTLAVGDKVWLASKNKTDATNFTIEHCNINLHLL